MFYYTYPQRGASVARMPATGALCNLGALSHALLEVSTGMEAAGSSSNEDDNPSKRQRTEKMIDTLNRLELWSAQAKQEREESSREAPPQRKLRGGGSGEEPPAHRTSAFGMQGKRAAMEDAHVVASQGPVTVAGVFDGCGGARAAKLCGARLASEKLRRALLDARAGDAAPAIAAFLASCETAVDAEARRAGWVDATTAVVAVVNGDTLSVGWVGDSRCVVVSDAGARVLTRDHNASNPAEAQRVRAAGGLVGRNEKEAKASKATKLAAKVLSPNIAYRTHPKNPMRVYPGGITLTRALGGRPLKMKSSCPVVADAETATVPVAGATHVILACDGVWDVLDAAGAAAVVVGARPDDAAETLARAAFEKGSTDNITAVVVELPSTPAARSEPEAEAAE